MNDEILSKEFYVNHDGVLDEFTTVLNCFQTALYFALKIKHGIEKPYELFLNNSPFYIMFNHEGIMRDINLHKLWSCREVFTTESVSGKGMETFAGMEERLNQGKIVLFETHVHRVPYFERFFGEDYAYDPKLHNHAANHLFVALAHRDTELFYLEAPWLLHRDYTPYRNSKCIGVISKAALKPAFDCFLNYHIVHINDEGINEENYLRRVRFAVKDILDQMNLPPQTTPDGTYYYNGAAIETLIRAGKEGLVRLDQPTLLYAMTECDFLEWKLSIIRHQKHVLYQCIRKWGHTFGRNAQSCADALGRSADHWQLVVNKLRLMQRRKKYEIGDILTALEGLAECEARAADELFRLYQGAVFDTA